MYLCPVDNEELIDFGRLSGAGLEWLYENMTRF